MATVVVFVAFLASCHYDWAVGPPGDVAEGGADASAADGADAAAGTDGAAEAQGNQCDMLEAQIGIARTGILHCTQTCAQSVYSECGCDIAVENATSKEATDYSAAVKAYKDAGCHNANCQACDTQKHECVTFQNIDVCS